jgi:tetratricopeptide (TPR) repeat protein
MDTATRKATLEQAAARLADDPAGAEAGARQVLAAAPGDPNAGLILASALRRQGRAADAIAVLEPLLRAYSRAHPLHYEKGMALADLGEAARAIVSLRTATELGPEHADAWRALGALLFDAGDARGAEAAFDQHHRALVRDPRLQSAAQALYGGRPGQAETLLRPIVEAEPNDLVALDLLAEANARLGYHQQAADLLAQVLARTPDDNQVRFRLARALHHRRKSAEALAHLEVLLAAEPGNPAFKNLAATALSELGEFDRAVTIYESLLTDRDRHASSWANYAHALRIVGRAADAAAAYRRAIDLDPAQGEAYLGLANLKVGALSDDEVDAIRRLSSRPDVSLGDRQALAFALGQALEDRGGYEGAFGAYAAGAAGRRADAPYDAQAFTDQIRRSIELFDTAFFAERAGFGAAAPDPIFIVGLPRSGSTLIEQILASHSAVEATAELPDIGFIAESLGAYPDAVAGLGREASKTLGEGYIASTQVQRKLGRPFFIDKMPNNFQFLGLIALILPNAKIIDARRHPMATCFSAFKQHFAQGQAFSYDLGDLGAYYRDYVALMDHFDRVLPGKVHRVIYEDLVEDTEGQVRRLLDYCGLAFEPQCLAFHETRRAVRTASSEQVRRPIFREGLAQWRNFEPWLGRLKEALGPALETWRS